MNIYTEYSQSFWLKFTNQGFKYLLFLLKKPKWCLMFCLSRIRILRSWGIYISKRSWQPTYKIVNSFFQEVNTDLAVEQLKAEGLYIGINLPNDILSEILEFANSTNYLGNANANFNFPLELKDKTEFMHQQKFLTAHHINPSLLCPAIQEIEKDLLLWKIAASYLETKPILVESRLRWTFAIENEKIANKSLFLPFNFHYDLEDYRCIKFMFYLKDVDRACGPHVCVRGSHKKKKLSHQFSLIRATNEEKIVDFYGNDRVETICGQAGLGFVEDFYCFHRATLPTQHDRLILEVKFAMNDYNKTNRTAKLPLPA